MFRTAGGADRPSPTFELTAARQYTAAGTPRCDLLVVDLHTGAAPHSPRLEGAIHELFDVAAIPGVVRPMALGFSSEEIRRLITIAPDGGRSGAFFDG